MKLYRIFRKPPFFMRSAHYLKESDHAITEGPNSRRAIIVPILAFQFGNSKAFAKSHLYISKFLLACIKGMIKSASNLKKNPISGRRIMTSEDLDDIETYAKSMGVESIGYTKVNRDHIFKEFHILTDNAMIITMKMDKEIIDTNPSLATTKEIFRTYYELGVIVNKLADRLRSKGYRVHASPALGGDINTVPTGRDANLGYVGKNGILITPEEGPCVRLAGLFIDVDNLPIASTNDHKWIESFCDSCNKCVRMCPGNAIFKEPLILEDGTKQYIDAEKCAEPFSKGCSMCISECVFTGGHYDKIKSAYLKEGEQLAEV